MLTNQKVKQVKQKIKGKDQMVPDPATTIQLLSVQRDAPATAKHLTLLMAIPANEKAGVTCIFAGYSLQLRITNPKNPFARPEPVYSEAFTF